MANMYSATPYTDEMKAKKEADRQKNWQQMLQAAALASKMNDQTALGFGLGSLLASNWDKWFGGKDKKNSDGNSDGQYSFSANMATAQDPLKFAAAGGDHHAQWALENNQPFSLASVAPVTIAANQMPNNLTVDGVNPQEQATGNTFQAGMPLTQQLSFNGQTIDPQKAMMDSNFNPANSANFFKAAGVSTSPWSSPSNYQLTDTDFLKKKYPWEVQ